MIRSTVVCLVFILTNAVMAQAAETGAVHINAQKWVTTYAGETEVDGLPVLANLDESQLGLQIPEAMADIDGGDLIVPSLMPVVKKSYRLNLLVSHNPRIQIAYPIESRRVSIDGSVRAALVSDLEPNKDFHFVITQEANGSLHVTYTRKVTDGRVLTGDFMLAPVPHILSK